MTQDELYHKMHFGEMVFSKRIRKKIIRAHNARMRRLEHSKNLKEKGSLKMTERRSTMPPNATQCHHLCYHKCYTLFFGVFGKEAFDRTGNLVIFIV